MDEIHEPGGGVPFRMAPLVLLTVITHRLWLAGREGTAADRRQHCPVLAKKLKLSKEDIRRCS